MPNLKLSHHDNVLVISMKNGRQHVKTEQDMGGFSGIIRHSHLLYDPCSIRIDQSQIADWKLYHNVWVAEAYTLTMFERAIGTTDVEATNNLNKRISTYAQAYQEDKECSR